MKQPLAGGEPRRLPPEARRSRAAVDLAETAELTIVVRSRGPEEEWRTLVEQATRGLPHERRYLTRAELAKQWAASPEDLEAVRKFAASQRLRVVSSDAFRRCVVVSGSLRQFARVFGVELQGVRHPLGTFRTHRGVPHLPAPLLPLVECILGLDTLPAARPHAAAAAGRGGMDRQALLDAYAVPKRLHGKGQCIAIIELGGGVHRSDLRQYFRQLKLAPPKLRIRGIGEVKNNPVPRADIRKFLDGTLSGSDPSLQSQVEWTLETTTDVSIVGTFAPEASILLVLTSGSDQGQYHAVSSVIADTRNDPSVLSCSWGGPEYSQTPALMPALDRWFQAAAVLGMTVCYSSGDMADGTGYVPAPPKRFIIQFPASSPHVLTVGGTTLHPKAGTEIAWHQVRNGELTGSGGGFSTFFPLPPWQRAAGISARQWIPRGAESGKGRAIPDIAAKANMESAYSVIVGGVEAPAGGTSTAAPIWAALAALLNEGTKSRLGLLHAPLYDGTLAPGLRDIVKGNTGQFHACKGWDACTGWGSPKGETLVRLLRG
ncbi:MAG TPA: S53 family peptidase [Thermoanaerobaculia bacterium]|nr:S53 family peptidase [Thermoanaerobaculia bacterium]